MYVFKGAEGYSQNSETRKTEAMRPYVRCSATSSDIVAFAVAKDVVVYRVSDVADGREIARMGFDTDVISVAISPCRTLVVAGMAGGLMEMRSLLDAGIQKGLSGAW